MSEIQHQMGSLRLVNHMLEKGYKLVKIEINPYGLLCFQPFTYTLVESNE